MAKFNNTMDVFKLLPKTNCRKCNKPTCLAFAAEVFQGKKPLADCPLIGEDLVETYGDQPAETRGLERDYLEHLAKIKKTIAQTDLSEKAEKLGGVFSDGKLTLKILGKPYSIHENGDVATDIHVNEWISMPVFSYILNGAGLEPAGQWVPFRELETSADWQRFFEHQCVGSFKTTADTYPNFFGDIIELFNGREVKDHYEADISLIIHPLPRLPMLLCYNHPEDGLESDLNLFFDATADKNLPVQDIYTISTGLSRMFAKLAQTHG